MPWTKKKVRQALNMAVNRQELLKTIFAGKGTLAYVSGWSAHFRGLEPGVGEPLRPAYGYNPAKAKELLKEAGYGPGQLKFKILAFTDPGSRRARRWPRR